MSKPVRLAKVQDNTASNKVVFEAFLERYAPYILLILIIVLCVLIIALIVAMVSHGNANVTMVESGNYYNHLQDVI